MTATVSKVIDEIQTLSPTEKGFVVQCIISSLDTQQDENSSKEWADLAKKRFEELNSRSVEPVSWDSIKKQVLNP